MTKKYIKSIVEGRAKCEKKILVLSNFSKTRQTWKSAPGNFNLK